MTRGTITFIDFNSQNNIWDIYVSPEFNGDMGPDMSSGQRLLEYFREIFYNENNHSSKKSKLQEIVLRMIKDFGYDEDYSHEEFLDVFTHFQIPANNDFTILDLTKKFSANEETIDYRNDGWTKYFNYSDWGYLIDISGLVPHKIIKVKAYDALSDKTEITVSLSKNILYMFYFRNLSHFFTGKQINDYDYLKSFQEKEIVEETIENFKDVKESNFTISDIVVTKFQCEPDGATLTVKIGKETIQFKEIKNG